jgi:broad specificity phosphatase PhoE
MKRELILIRHSQPRVDQKLPPHQWVLTAEGRARCISLAARLAVYGPGVVVTSDELKAIETGEIVARELGIPRYCGLDIHEHRRSGGVLLDQAAFDDKIRNLFAHPGCLVFGLETARQALDRFSTALPAIMDAYPDQNVAVVSHGTVMSLYYGALSGENSYQFWRRLGIPAFYTVLWPDAVVSSQVMQVETF